jgi:hypothetical protein
MPSSAYLLELIILSSASITIPAPQTANIKK